MASNDACSLKLRAGLTALAALIILSLFSCASNGRDFSGDGEYASPLFDRISPVFSIPAGDIEKKNGIEAVFVHESKEDGGILFEITVVFQDEDHPSGIVDTLYDAYRSIKYRRVRDVETFFFHFSIEGAEASVLDFPGTYGGEQVFREKKVQHFSAEVPASAFEYIESHPVIFVTTWNHMFCEVQTNAGMETVLIDNYPVFSGNRSAAEDILRR